MARTLSNFPLFCSLIAGILLTPSAARGTPLAIVKNQDLSFGKFAGGSGQSGSVTVTTTGTRSAAGGVILVGSASFAPARYTITGNSGASYTLTIPSSFTMSSGGAQMTVGSLAVSVPTTGALPAGGSLPFTLGGTLAVGTSTVHGSYSGTFAVTLGK